MKSNEIFIIECNNKIFKRSYNFYDFKNFIVNTFSEIIKNNSDDFIKNLFNHIHSTDNFNEIQNLIYSFNSYRKTHDLSFKFYPINVYQFKAIDSHKTPREIILYSEDTGKIQLISKNEVIKNRENITNIKDWKTMHYIDTFTQSL